MKAAIEPSWLLHLVCAAAQLSLLRQLSALTSSREPVLACATCLPRFSSVLLSRPLMAAASASPGWPLKCTCIKCMTLASILGVGCAVCMHKQPAAVAEDLSIAQNRKYSKCVLSSFLLFLYFPLYLFFLHVLLMRNSNLNCGDLGH